MHKKLVILSCFVLFVAASATGQTTVRCESTDGRYRECSIDGIGRIALTQQISDTNCVLGKNWGFRDGTVWVDEGCRGDFALVERGFQARGTGKVVVCESEDGKRTNCATPSTADGVAVVRQFSRSSCIQGRSWGYTPNGIWVDEGCRAEFVIGSHRFEPGYRVERLDRLVLCESKDGKPMHCPGDTSGGVQVVRQISQTPCRFGEQWGYDGKGIWVAGGCRAEFAVRSEPVPKVQVVTTTPVPATRTETHVVTQTLDPPTLLCESQNNKRAHCRTDIRYGVVLHRQISQNSCVRDRTWGVDPDGIWVTDGCRGEFLLGEPTTVAFFTPVPAPSTPLPATLLCESNNNTRNHCRTDTRYGITLVRQVSDAACVRDRTWGVDKDGVWVTEGCRGEFTLGHDAPAVAMMSSAPSTPTVICESIDGQRNRCAVDTSMGIRLLRQVSGSDCVLNGTWGYDADGIWVSKGCRAEFAIGEGRVPAVWNDAPQASRVLCESKDGKRNVCAADTRLGVAVVRQVSDSPCVLNSTWGYNTDGIWVTAGCRAEFVMRR